MRNDAPRRSASACFLKQDPIVSGYASRRSSGIYHCWRMRRDALFSREARFTWEEGGSDGAMPDYTVLRLHRSTGTRRWIYAENKKEREGRRATRDLWAKFAHASLAHARRATKRVTAGSNFQECALRRAPPISCSCHNSVEWRHVRVFSRRSHASSCVRDCRVPRNSAIPQPHESDAASR